jgi:hypothetical protein
LSPGTFTESVRQSPLQAGIFPRRGPAAINFWLLGFQLLGI